MNDSPRFLQKYLNELIDYGGLPCTRAEAILDMQSVGIDRPSIDRWLQGNDLAQRLRERNQRVTLRLYAKATASAP